MKPFISLFSGVLLVFAVLLPSARVCAEDDARTPLRSGVVGGAALLGTPDVGAGLAFDMGARLELNTTHAFSLRAGYGVLVGDRETQDKWWILASYGAQLALDRGLRLELGGGLGAGAVSGYENLDAFIAAPFDPHWAYQLLPAVTAHARLWMDDGPHASWFVGAELGGLVDVPGLGVREGNAHQASDLMWLTLSVGTAFWP